MLSSCFFLLNFLNKAPILIGVSVDLSGPSSDLGIALRNGAQLAMEEINNSGGINGREIQLVIKDDQGDPNTALQADQDLIDQEVVAIVGHSTSQQTASVLDLINQNDVLLIGPAASSFFYG